MADDKINSLVNIHPVESNINQPWLWVAIIAVAVFALDVVTKVWAAYKLQGRSPITVIPGFFSLEYSENTGIAFGLFTNYSGILHILTPLAFMILLYLVFRQFRDSRIDRWYILFIGLIIGGALGNILNRLYLGYVVDFILVYYQDHRWPNFNIADSALTVGEVILIYKLFFAGEPEPEVKAVASE